LSITDELPKEFKPLIVLGEIEGYLHVFSVLDDNTISVLLDMAMQSLNTTEYDEKTTTLQ
jgi:hypothetical protein